MTQPCMCGLGYTHMSLFQKEHKQQKQQHIRIISSLVSRGGGGWGDVTGGGKPSHIFLNSNLTCLHVDRCFRQNFQPDSQISVIVTPCLADIKKKKNHSQR